MNTQEHPHRISPMYRRAKRVAETALLHGGIARIARRLMRGRALILAYHNVVPKGEHSFGDRSLHLSQQAFAQQLDWVRSTCSVVPLESILQEVSDCSKPRVAITFDDAYSGAVTAGVAEIAARGLPATIFVAPAFVGGRSFWWDSLVPDSEAGLPLFLRIQALDVFRGQDTAVRTWAKGRRIHLVSPPKYGAGATEDELYRASRVAGISFGSHTWSHPNLARLQNEELFQELSAPLVWLHERFACVVPWLSYPYGISSPIVERAAELAGYRAALRVAGGWLPRGHENPFVLPRMNVPAGLSLEGFALRMAGLLRG